MNQTLYQTIIQHVHPYTSDIERPAIAKLILEECTQLPLHEALLIGGAKLELFSEKINKIVSKIKRGVPIQYALGYAYFYNLKLKVTPSVLIPRQETEELVHMVLKENMHRNTAKVMDLCTGSGAIALALQSNSNSWIIQGVDISSEALTVASFNAQKLNLETSFLSLDLRDGNSAAQLVTGSFDIIVSNPPYVRNSEAALMDSTVLDHEPHLALFVPDENALLFYKEIAKFARHRLAKGGKLYLEINEALGRETVSILKQEGFLPQIHQDLNGKDRMISARRD